MSDERLSKTLPQLQRSFTVGMGNGIRDKARMSGSGFLITVHRSPIACFYKGESI
ncbi:MAG TPA: hypothetical protein VLH40_07675 [Atribacteraceae bacterium]|nr:hypothetical protein [Atribacteraceae bacterium]